MKTPIWKFIVVIFLATMTIVMFQNCSGLRTPQAKQNSQNQVDPDFQAPPEFETPMQRESSKTN